MRWTPALLALALIGCGSTHHVVAPPPPPIDEATPLPGAAVTVAGTAVTVASSEELAVSGPIATSTVHLTVRNGSQVVAEAALDLRLPADAVVGRLALDVDGRWMEGEVLPRATAARIYDGILHPATGRGRDPALLVGRDDGGWSLNVFPVPANGERHVDVVYHRIVPATPGTARVEALPPSLGADGWVVAAAPSFPRAVAAGARPATVVIALDTSLSLGESGLAQALAAARAVLAVRPDARLVTGDLHPHVCTDPVETCLATVEAGGGTDLEALLTEAFHIAGVGPAAVVLISDGRPTIGSSGDGLTFAVAPWIAASPLALHTVAVGRARTSTLARLADVGLGTADGAIDRALASGRRPRFEVPGADAIEVVTTARGPVMLARFTALPLVLHILRTDDAGATRSRIDLDRGPRSGFGIARLLGARLVANADDDAPLLARAWGIATDQAALLALEHDADYGERGIAQYKAVERALELGQPAPVIGDLDRAADRALQTDADGDGILDVDDRCPAEAETMNGFTDDDGCPDRVRVIIEQQELRILERVYFEAGRATISRRALPLLDEVANVMQAYPMLRLVALEGHRDRHEPARGTLGQRRAAAVRAALITRGVEPDRLIAIDLDDHYPLTPSRTADDRARNRRVEFKVLRRTSTIKVAELLAEEVMALASAGAPRWKLEAAVARAALARGDRPAANAAFARARAATERIDERLWTFTPDLAAAWPAEYLDAVRAAATVEIPPEEADADRYYAALATLPLDDADRAAPALRRSAMRWLEGLADPDRRLRTSAARLAISADLLAWLGRTDEAARRRSEIAELAELGTR